MKQSNKGRVQKFFKKNYGKFHTRGEGGSTRVIFHNQFFGKSLVWEEKLVGAATIVADFRV